MPRARARLVGDESISIGESSRGLLVALHGEQRVAEQERRLGGRALRQRGPREPLGPRRIGGGQRLPCRVQHDLGRELDAGFQRPRRDPARVAASRHPRFHCGLGESTRGLHFLERRELGAQHLRVQGVRDTNRAHRLCALDHDEPVPAELREQLSIDDAARHRERQRLTEGDQRERIALRLLELVQARMDQVGQPPRRDERSARPPQVARLVERTLVDRGAYQLAQEEQVPARELPETVDRAPLDRPPQCIRQEHVGLVARQRLELEVVAAAVLPQRRDRVGCGLARALRGQHRGCPLDRQPVHEHGARVVEQVRVVDHDEQRAGPGGDRGQ